jgi:glycosyltransferase involved in cell wall biosynthesis
LIPRDADRGDRFEDAAYFGWPQNLADPLHESRWRARLGELGLRWRIVPRWQWNDYSGVDVVVAIRSFSGHTFGYKPATKLYQAWHAGVPAVLGAESAYIAERRSDLDYLEAPSFDETVAALRRLRDDPSLRRAMIENGRRRAEESSPRCLVERWSTLLNDVAKPAWRRWREQSDSQQRDFLTQRAAALHAARNEK